jgi:hypothetical protein
MLFLGIGTDKTVQKTRLKQTFAFVVLIATFTSVIFPLRSCAQVLNQAIFDNQLENGWLANGSAAVSLANANPVLPGYSDSISVTAGISESVSLEAFEGFASSNYSSLQFEICGGTAGVAGGQQLQILATTESSTEPAYSLQPLPGDGVWAAYNIPLSALAVANVPNLDGFVIQAANVSAEPTYYIGAVTLVANNPPPSPVTISVDATANQHPISPLIYGLNYATTAQLEDLNAPYNCYGGGQTSLYNWEQNSTNVGSAYFFVTGRDASATAGADADADVAIAKAAGVQPAITIPTIGWVANLSDGGTAWSYSIAKYGPQQEKDPSLPDAGNGVLLDGQFVDNNPNDANTPATVSYQQGWINHLISTWGSSQDGGVEYYLMDNEPSIWQETHRDVHPVGAKMAEVEADIASYGAMIKAADPNALILGPEEWGWLGYFYSGFDAQNPSHPDQAAHGGMYYLPWVLQQLQAAAVLSGQRTLDYFTLHFFPQGGEYADTESVALDLLRNRSTRQLWDPTYVSESWIGASGINGGIVDLIPLMQSWVTTYYPGTKLGIDEYNWGDEDGMNGATSQADIEGIFGQQALDLAARWKVPDPTGPAYQAMKIFRNYDGNKSAFGDTSVADTVPDPDNLSSFAAVRESDGALTIVVDNKWISGPSTSVTLNVADFNAGLSAQVWQLAAPGTTIVQLANAAIAAGAINFSAPPQSITLLIVPPAPVIASISPTTTSAGGLDATLTVNGTGFTTASTVDWNGTPLSTNYGSATWLTAIVPVPDMKSAGSESITVSNGASTSNTKLFTVTASITIASFTIQPTSGIGGASYTGSLTFNGVAPVGGQRVNLKSSNTEIATVKSSTTVAAGKTTKVFTITTVPVTTMSTIAITAKMGGVAAHATLTVQAPSVKSVTLSPTSVVGGASSTGTVKLTGVAAVATTVTLTSNSNKAGVPPTVVVAAGANTATFTVSTIALTTKKTATISAAEGGASKSANLTIEP